MSETLDKKIAEIKQNFQLQSTEARYSALIEIGKQLPLLSADKRTSDRIVQGCQSILYLGSELRNGKIYFQAATDALITAGLATLLIMVYSGEFPETVLKGKPDFLTDLGLQQSLSPSRSNGIYEIFLKMKKESLKYLI